MDISDPNGWFEVGRLVKGVSYADGYLEFTPDELLNVPLVPNELMMSTNLLDCGRMIFKHQFFPTLRRGTNYY